MRKKLIQLMTAILLPLAVNAQEKQEGHLKFKGVEIKNSAEYLKKALCENAKGLQWQNQSWIPYLCSECTGKYGM